MTTTINKNDLSNARYTKQLVSPAIEALRKITPHAVGCVEAHEKIIEFASWLQKFSLQADDVISFGNAQYEARPQALINAAALRMSLIPSDIEREQQAIVSKISSHEAKSKEMQKQSFTSEEISNILPYPQIEIDGHTAAILNLKSELQKTGKFLSSAPVYDVSLLDLEKLSPYLQHHKTAAE
jgi:hypothetical protein